ncbi:hypothetical protein [Escherichia coli]|jgi:hypothetical protein
MPTVDELATDPERLKKWRPQCKTDSAKLSDELCKRVAEVTRKRF